MQSLLNALKLVRAHTLPQAHQQAKEMACMSAIMALVQFGHDIVVTERRDTGARSAGTSLACIS